MRTNRFMVILATLLGAIAVTNTTNAVAQSTNKAASYSDDLYGIHDREALAEAEAAAEAAEAALRAENERRIAAMVAAANAEADIDDLLGSLGESSITTSTTAGGGNNVSIYNNIYVDDYSSAYARRLQGFTSLTYRLPSSYYDYRYGDAYFLTLAYDPAFYTVMIVGDQVWVEPRYITNMFGSWNNPYYYGYRYGYNPYYYGYSYCYYDPWGWNSPYWGCDPFYHYHYHHYWHHHHHHYHDHHVHRPGYHNPSYRPGGPGGHHGDRYRDTRVEHRPSYGSAGSVSYPAGGRPSYNDRLGGRTTDRGSLQVPGANSSAGRGGAVGNAGGASSTRPGTTVTTSGRPNSGTEGGRVTGTTVGNHKGDRNVPLDGSLSKSLNATTIRGNASSGRSNSSSRVSTTESGRSSSNRSSSSVSSSRNSNRSSSNVRSNSSSSNRSSSSRSSVSSSRSSSSSSSATTSRSSSSSSSRSSGSTSRGSSRR